MPKQSDTKHGEPLTMKKIAESEHFLWRSGESVQKQNPDFPPLIKEGSIIFCKHTSSWDPDIPARQIRYSSKYSSSILLRLLGFDTLIAPVYIETRYFHAGKLMENIEGIDRVAIITVHGDSADDLARNLTDDGFSVTLIDSSGGILLEPSSTFLIGFSQQRTSVLLDRIRAVARTKTRWIPTQPSGTLLPAMPQMIEAETGGATIAVLTAERVVQL